MMLRCVQSSQLSLISVSTSSDKHQEINNANCFDKPDHQGSFRYGMLNTVLEIVGLDALMAVDLDVSGFALASECYLVR